MKLDPRRLRILFVDDEELEIVNAMVREGYDVEHWKDVDNLDRLCDGRYHIVFLDVRGIGERYNGNGLDILKYVATHNPLIYAAVFSAKPFTGVEADLIRKFARRSITKDCTLYDLVEVVEEYSESLNDQAILNRLQDHVKLTWYMRWRIRRGHMLSSRQLETLKSTSSFGADGLKIVANITTIAAGLIKLSNGISL